MRIVESQQLNHVNDFASENIFWEFLIRAKLQKIWICQQKNAFKNSRQDSIGSSKTIETLFSIFKRDYQARLNASQNNKNCWCLNFSLSFTAAVQSITFHHAKIIMIENSFVSTCKTQTWISEKSLVIENCLTSDFNRWTCTISCCWGERWCIDRGWMTHKLLLKLHWEENLQQNWKTILSKLPRIFPSV